MIVRKTNKTETLFTFDFGDVPFVMDSMVVLANSSNDKTT